MSLRPLIFFISCVSMLSCSQDKTIYMLDNEANGVQVGTEVVGIKVGKVDYLTVTPEGEVLMTAIIDHELTIPEDSKFRNIEGDMAGKKQISIAIGESDQLLADSDTVDLRSALDKLLNFGKEEMLDKLLNKAEEEIMESEVLDTLVESIEDIFK